MREKTYQVYLDIPIFAKGDASAYDIGVAVQQLVGKALGRRMDRGDIRIAKIIAPSGKEIFLYDQHEKSDTFKRI